MALKKAADKYAYTCVSFLKEEYSLYEIKEIVQAISAHFMAGAEYQAPISRLEQRVKILDLIRKDPVIEERLGYSLVRWLDKKLKALN